MLGPLGQVPAVFEELVVDLRRVHRAAQFERRSPYYDPKSARAAPRWVAVDVRALKKTRLVPLAELRRQRALAKMWLLRPGSRLSITPVSPAEWRTITERLA